MKKDGFALMSDWNFSGSLKWSHFDASYVRRVRKVAISASPDQ
jgi:hypothetical protein